MVSVNANKDSKVLTVVLFYVLKIVTIMEFVIYKLAPVLVQVAFKVLHVNKNNVL